MTISELTLKSRDEEPVRRLEIFTGAGRRREWPPEEKARIVAESYEAGETVCAVARRYGLTSQQLETSNYRSFGTRYGRGNGRSGVNRIERGFSIVAGGAPHRF